MSPIEQFALRKVGDQGEGFFKSASLPDLSSPNGPSARANGFRRSAVLRPGRQDFESDCAASANCFNSSWLLPKRNRASAIRSGDLNCSSCRFEKFYHVAIFLFKYIAKARRTSHCWASAWFGNCLSNRCVTSCRLRHG